MQAAYAGPAASQNRTFKFSIRDEAGQLIESQDVSGLLSNYDSSTGDLSTVPVGTAPGSLPGVVGNWGWSNIDVTNDQVMDQKILTWQSIATTTTANGLVAQSTVQLKANGNIDPTMTYSFSAKNNTAVNQTFTFSYGESIVPPVSGNYFINADIAGSVTRGNTTQNAQITPVLGDFDGDGISEIQTLKLSTDGGLTFLNAGVDVGTAHTSAFKTNPFGTDYAEAYGNLSSINYWQFDVAFSLTPNKDATALSGSAEISAIPEPSTSAIMLGVASLALVVRCRRPRVGAGQ